LRPVTDIIGSGDAVLADLLGQRFATSVTQV
jgi:hypothetical protein